MTKRLTQIAGLSALALAAAAPVLADIKINDNLSVGGYTVSSITSTSVEKAETVSTLDHTASKLAFNYTFAPVTATVSLFSGASNSPVILDAYFKYDLGGGASATGGKFLSWLGYEAFDPVNMVTNTYAWSSELITVGGIPAYHTGVKVEYGTDSFGAGFAVVDSNDPFLITAPIFHKGDGDLDNGAGLEGYFTYKTKDLTVFLGVAHNSYENDLPLGPDNAKSYSVDLWAQYVVGPVTFAGEYCIAKHNYELAALKDIDHSFWGLWATFAASEKISYVGRIAGGKNDTGAPLTPSYIKYTFSPVINLTANLQLAAEATLTSYDNLSVPGQPIDTSKYFGLQARFKF